MKIKRQKTFAKTGVVKEVRQSTEWIKKTPFRSRTTTREDGKTSESIFRG